MSNSNPQKTKRFRIETLPQSVIDRIAAGEVVERPAAVIKELIENAIDANATKIQVIVVDAGRTLMKVVDNGIGMTAEELVAAVGRHATSKLRRFEDLETLETFGFRGEALPSIAAVSRMEILSCPLGEEIGARLKISAGIIESCEPAACPYGTSVSVSHLFHNVPARRKFLRSDATEFKWIATTFKYFALVFPNIEFELYRNETLLYQLSPGDARARIAGLFGDDIAEDLVPINYAQQYVKITGFISKNPLPLKTGGEQYFFVNSRPIVNPRLNRAILNALESTQTPSTQPFYFVNILCPPDRFDINVHPAKKEVKFADEQLIYNTLWGAIRRSMGAIPPPEMQSISNNTIQSSPKTVSTPTETPQPDSQRIKRPERLTIKVPIDAPSHLTPYISITTSGRTSRTILPFPKAPQTDKPISEEVLPDDESSHPSLYSKEQVSTFEGPVILQFFNTYLVSQLTTGIVFIDQHIAHERILYEQALNAMESMPLKSQQLLFPSSISVNSEDIELLESIKPLLQTIGFEIEPFGPREYRILSVPAGLKISNERGILLEIIDELLDSSNLKNERDFRKKLAAAFACRAAIKAGEPLEPEERLRLIEDLFRTSEPEFCPHGRPVYYVLSKREIEKWFKR